MQQKGLVVIDGPDGTGKTTLAEHLASTYDGEYIHLDYAPGEEFRDHDDHLRYAITQSHDHLVIIDRHWISGLIYARVYRDISPMRYNARAFDRLIRKHAGLYVIACDTPSVVAERFNDLRTKRKEMYSYGMQEVSERYYAFLFGGRFHWPQDFAGLYETHGGFLYRNDVLHYALGVHQMERFAERILHKVRECRAIQPYYTLYPGFTAMLGHIEDTRVVFVVDEQVSTGAPWPCWGNGPVESYLNQALHLACLDETKAVWVNLQADGGPDALTDCLLQGLVPVCLGHRAAESIKNTGLRISTTVLESPSDAYHTGQSIITYAQTICDKLRLEQATMVNRSGIRIFD